MFSGGQSRIIARKPVIYLHDGLQTGVTVRQRYGHEVSGGAICRLSFTAVEESVDAPFPRDAFWSLNRPLFVTTPGRSVLSRKRVHR